MDAQLNEVASVLRSCLITSKNGSHIDHLNKDYKCLEGRNIPYQRLGFPTLEALLKVVPGVRMTRRGLDLWVEAIPTRETAHISRLVANQNQSRSHRRRPPFVRPPPSRRPQPAFQSRFRPANAGMQNTRPAASSRSSPMAAMPVTVYPPRLQPLMQQIVPPPNTSPSRPRYAAANADVSPSKRMIERNIQPQQHLDRENQFRARSAMPVTVYSPKKTAPAEPVKRPILKPLDTSNRQRQPGEVASPMTPNTAIPPLFPKNPMRAATPISPMTPFSGRPEGLETSMTPMNSITPMTPPTTPMTPMAPMTPPSWSSTGVSRVGARLIIQPTPAVPAVPAFSNTTVTNGNGNIHVTFKNTLGGGSDCPTDPRESLKVIVRELNLPAPEYKDVSVHGKNRSEGKFYAQVLIGPNKYSSYPEEAKTETEAQILAAKQALVELRKELASKFCLSATMDKKLMKSRILAIVDQHNGVFTHKIPVYYQEQHKENLPEYWTKEIEKWTEVTMDKGVDKSTILRRRVPCTEKASGVSSPRVDKVLLTPMGPAKPGTLELPEENLWIVYVTLVQSLDEIWVRLVDECYSDKFDDMTVEMIEHYSTTKYPISEVVEVGDYFAMLEDEYCHRVRVIDYDTTSCEATIFFIDSGFEDTVSASKLLPLDKKFCLLAAQAIKVSLAGLEELAECRNTFEFVQQRIEKLLLDGIFYVEKIGSEVNDDGPVHKVIFFDTTGPEDINLNDIISKKILQQLLSTIPRLEEDKQITEVHISHVEDNGDVFIQIKHEGMKYLVGTLNKLISTSLTEEDIKRCSMKFVDRSSVYFVKCSETGDWFRAKVIDTAGAEWRAGEIPRIKVFLIDFGRTITVLAENVLQLELLSDVLTNYPAQAMKVRLSDIEPSMIDEKVIARLKELAPPSENLLLKVIKPSYRGSPPTVDLFKRNEADGALIAINLGLVVEFGFSKSNGDGNNNVRPRKRLERTNSRVNGHIDESRKELKPPKISDIGEYFDVHVTMAASPSNFTVQPHTNMTALAKMMAELQEVCLAYQGPHPSLESIREGGLYAAYYNDGHWYRVCISNIINEHMVTVYFCDYGDVTVITLDKLQPLLKQFRELPYQAIKARLVGIQPTNKDWSPEDCVRFQELAVERVFVSIVAESAPDKHSPGDTVLGLQLIDVSTPDDIYVARILVDEGRATYVD